MTATTQSACLLRLREMDDALARMQQELPDDVRALGVQARSRVAVWLARLAEGTADLQEFGEALREISGMMDALTSRLLLAPWEGPAASQLKS